MKINELSKIDRVLLSLLRSRSINPRLAYKVLGTNDLYEVIYRLRAQGVIIETIKDTDKRKPCLYVFHGIRAGGKAAARRDKLTDKGFLPSYKLPVTLSAGQSKDTCHGNNGKAVTPQLFVGITIGLAFTIAAWFLLLLGMVWILS